MKKQEYLRQYSDADFKELNKEFSKEYKNKFIKGYENDRYTKKSKRSPVASDEHVEVKMPENAFEDSAEEYHMPGVGEIVDTILGSGEERDEL